MKKYALTAIIFLLAIGLTFGCAAEERVDPNNNADPNNNVDPNITQDDTTQENVPRPGERDITDNNQDNEQNIDIVPGENQNDDVDMDNNNNINNGVNNDNNGGNNGNNGDNNEQEQAERLADIASDVEGVRDATVVITGDTAYVGIDIDSNTEDEQTNRVKDEVGERVKEEEDSIERVLVSADADTIERLEEIGEDIGDGRPISGFLDELTEMFRRPTPSAE